MMWETASKKLIDKGHNIYFNCRAFMKLLKEDDIYKVTTKNGESIMQKKYFK